MPTSRTALGVAVVDGKVYAIGGYSSISRACVSANEQYDPQTDTWKTKAPMPTPRAYAAVVACKNKIYVIGGTVGYLEEGMLTNEVYDPTTDTWRTAGNPPYRVSHASADVIDGKIYLVGGDLTYDRTTKKWYGLSVLEYDPATNIWTSKAEIPYHGYNPPSVVVDGRIYVFCETRTQIYDAESDTWTQGAPMPIPLVSAAAAATSGEAAPKQVCVVGGYAGVNPRGEIFTQIYSPENNSWRAGADMPTYRGEMGLAAVNDKLYAIGGGSEWETPYSSLQGLLRNGLNTNEEYLPFGYGNPDPTYSTPLPSFTSQSTNSPSETASPISTATFTQTPMLTVSPTCSIVPTAGDYSLAIATILAVLAVFAIILGMAILVQNKHGGLH